MISLGGGSKPRSLDDKTVSWYLGRVGQGEEVVKVNYSVTHILAWLPKTIKTAGLLLPLRNWHLNDSRHFFLNEIWIVILDYFILYNFEGAWYWICRLCYSSCFRNWVLPFCPLLVWKKRKEEKNVCSVLSSLYALHKKPESIRVTGGVQITLKHLANFANHVLWLFISIGSSFCQLSELK